MESDTEKRRRRRFGRPPHPELPEKYRVEARKDVVIERGQSLEALLELLEEARNKLVLEGVAPGEVKVGLPLGSITLTLSWTRLATRGERSSIDRRLSWVTRRGRSRKPPAPAAK